MAELPVLPMVFATINVLAMVGLFFWPFGVTIVRLNQNAVNVNLLPYRDELESILRELEAST